MFWLARLNCTLFSYLVQPDANLAPNNKNTPPMNTVVWSKPVTLPHDPDKVAEIAPPSNAPLA